MIRHAAILLLLSLPAIADERRSGFDFMSPATQGMQREDALNPAMLWVAEGEAEWSEAPANAKSCAGCHGDASASMRGVAAGYPAFDERTGKAIDLQQRINACRTQHQ